MTHTLAAGSDGKSAVRCPWYGGRVVRVSASLKGLVVENIVNYRVVDYEHVNEDGDKEWRNTDPEGELTTDGQREGEGDPEATTEDIENSDWVNIGFQDTDGNWHYYWIHGPFDEEFWLDDAIEQIISEYGIVLGESA